MEENEKTYYEEIQLAYGADIEQINREPYPELSRLILELMSVGGGNTGWH